MTDKEKLIKLLDEFGVGYRLSDERYSEDDGETSNGIVIENEWFEENTKRITGYSGFYARFNFDENDAFKCVGIWE